MAEHPARPLVAGFARGRALVIEPLSFWGGCDPSTGVITDPHHAAAGSSFAARCIVMAHGAGSSSSASVLAEALHHGVGPAAIILERADGILVIGSVVAEELYGEGCPILVLPGATSLLQDGADLVVETDGRIST